MNGNRYLGLDIGTKRIGISVSDILFIIARPLETILRKPESTSVDKILALCAQYNITKIIAGLPINMNGTMGPQVDDVKQFINLLKEKTEIEIVFEDERLTSKQAEMHLTAQKKKPSKNKGLIDMASAAIILQQHLDKRR